MNITEMRTEHLAPEDRFPCWNEMYSRMYVSSLLSCENPAEFRARARVVDIGEIQISDLAISTVEARRTTKMIRQFDPEVYLLQLITSGDGHLAHGSRDAMFQARQFLLMDSSQPYHGRRSSTTGSSRAVLVQVPRASLGLRPVRGDRLVAAPFGADEGISAVLANHLLAVMEHAEHYTAADSVALADVTVNLIAATLAHHLDGTDPLSPQARKHALLAQIHRFIRQRLADPDLTADLIAAAHNISTRQLYKLFQSQGEGMGIAAFIRRSRLERCHRDLADPALRHHSVHTIAARWGLADSAHFSKIFRAAYGLSPRDHRHHAQHGDAMHETTRPDPGWPRAQPPPFEPNRSDKPIRQPSPAKTSRPSLG
ncbi:helix-turn-helix domain-containing protein [Sphaerisporangium sp. NPDC005289]|uniref:AraC-like ligand-binding domain-containing protein n=1 Tax=Sphaerisporangium sp. NPDC005289 TaxID=3155247 RepID=UPI0033A337DE